MTTTSAETSAPLFDAVVQAPFGRIGIEIRNAGLERVHLLDHEFSLREPADGLSQEVVAQLRTYFQQPRFRFSLPLRPLGTAFQQRVWEALRAIPSGSVCSYGALAQRLHTSARAIGGACRANPLPVIVPCHRVVGRTGIGGFAGCTDGPELLRKRWLLQHEGALPAAWSGKP